jgi:hypothetical protein
MNAIEILDGIASGRFIVDNPIRGYIYDKNKQAFTTKEDFETNNSKWIDARDVILNYKIAEKLLTKPNKL